MQIRCLALYSVKKKKKNCIIKICVIFLAKMIAFYTATYCSY